jgi:translation initiation factor IF-2
LKISDLAKKVNIPPKVLLIQIVKLGITVKSSQAVLSDESVEKILKFVAKKKPTLDIDKIKKSANSKNKTSKVQKTDSSKTSSAKSKTAQLKPKKKTEAVKTKKAQPKKTGASSAMKEKSLKIKSVKKAPEKINKGIPAEQAVIQPAKTLLEQPALVKPLPVEELPRSAADRTEKDARLQDTTESIQREAAIESDSRKPLRLKMPLTVKDLAEKISVPSGRVIKELMGMNVFASINQLIGEADAEEVGSKFGYRIEKLPTAEEEIEVTHASQEQDKKNLMHRWPVVTFMGHVDHGKTSLLDYIRKSKVTDQETGGITQHIGAYEVAFKNGKISFLDTPGHEAFTAMRARGANATDIVILVVAADDGLMPQTIEAIDHAKAADVPIIVAINKVDKPNIDIDRVKKQLAEVELLPEDWGGKVITVNVSAITGQGVDDLLEMILLEAEMLELKANPNKPAKGVVIEAKLSKGGGPIATVLVQNGTLRQGDIVVAGPYFGRIRALLDDTIHRVKEAPPSKPVEILGLSGIPQAGEKFMVVSDEKKAKQICSMRQDTVKTQESSVVRRVTLEDLYSQIKQGKVKELKIILKADVRGSLEAIAESLLKLGTKNMGLNIIHKGIGDINESDILLSAASNAIVIGFHVRKTPEGERAAKAEHVDTRLYNIIYEAIADVKAAMEGLLEPDIKESFRARILVTQVFKLSKSGIIAGSIVQKGKVLRNINCRLIRDGEIIYKGKIASLKRFKEDVKEVAEGFECGVKLENFVHVKNSDIIECFEIEKIARRL